MTSYNVDDFFKQITLKKCKEGIYKVLDKHTKKEILIKAPVNICPFGLEKYGNNTFSSYCLKLNLEDKYFFNFILEIENKLQKIQSAIDNKQYNINSQILNFENHCSKLLIKIKEYNNKFLTNIYNSDNEISIFDIKKNNNLEIELNCNLFIDNDTLTVKWSARTICVK